MALRLEDLLHHRAEFAGGRRAAKCLHGFVGDGLVVVQDHLIVFLLPVIGETRW